VVRKDEQGKGKSQKEGRARTHMIDHTAHGMDARKPGINASSVAHTHPSAPPAHEPTQPHTRTQTYTHSNHTHTHTPSWRSSSSSPASGPSTPPPAVPPSPLPPLSVSNRPKANTRAREREGGRAQAPPLLRCPPPPPRSPLTGTPKKVSVLAPPRRCAHFFLPIPPPKMDLISVRRCRSSWSSASRRARVKAATCAFD